MNNIRVLKEQYKLTKIKIIENIKVDNFKKIVNNIEPGFLYSFVTRKSISLYTFILYAIKEYKQIDELILATFKISKKPLLLLCDLILSGQIKKTHILLCRWYKTIMNGADNILEQKTKEIDNLTYSVDQTHAKVSLIKAGGKYLVLIGSGNYSENAKIENYCLIDNEELYNFHKGWIYGKTS